MILRAISTVTALQVHFIISNGFCLKNQEIGVVRTFDKHDSSRKLKVLTNAGNALVPYFKNHLSDFIGVSGSYFVHAETVSRRVPTTNQPDRLLRPNIRRARLNGFCAPATVVHYYIIQANIVAFWFNHDRDRIKARFAVREISTAKDITDWNDGKIPVALLHPASGGHGLNLQDGGSTLVWFGVTWSLELYKQMNARLWRQGQKNTVVIQHIITSGTHDEDVMRALDRKDMSQDALIEAVKARIGGGV